MTDRYDTTWDESDPAGSPGTEDAPPRPNFFKRLWMVFAKPEELFEALAENPAWFPMAVCVGVIMGFAMFLIPAEVFYETAAANAPPDQQAALRDVPLALFKWPAVFGTTVIVPLGAVLLSLFSYVAFVFMRGDRATFKQHLCVMSHASVITGVGTLVTVPLRIVNMNAQEALAVGDLFPFLDGYWSNVLNGMDLFAIWATVVAGLGLSVLDPRRRWAPTAAVLLVILVVFAMIGALFLP